MVRTLFALLILGSCVTAVGPAPAVEPAPLRIAADDWPWWRGPNRNGIAPGNQDPPLEWSATKNVRWRTSIPGRGHGSAIVVGQRTYITAADHDREQQLLYCLDRNDGHEIWCAVVHEGGFTKDGNRKASLASTTPACDGNSLFVNFLNGGAVFTSAFSLDGDSLWQTKISDYVVHQGYGSSPAVFGDLVLVSADNKGGGVVAGLNRATGEIVWNRARPAKPNYVSPVVLNVAGRDQLVFTGCDLVTGLNPATGEELWEVSGATTECVTSTVTDGMHVFTSGGYPKNHISAVAADGSGRVVWEKNIRTYVPSMIVRDKRLFAVLDAGIAMCCRSTDGEELWKGRLKGTFSSSPVLVNDRIYATNEAGTTFVFRASGEGFEQLAANQLGDSVFATATICGGRIYQRVAHIEAGERQEFLYCLSADE